MSIPSANGRLDGVQHMRGIGQKQPRNLAEKLDVAAHARQRNGVIHDPKPARCAVIRYLNIGHDQKPLMCLSAAFRSIMNDSRAQFQPPGANRIL